MGVLQKYTCAAAILSTTAFGQASAEPTIPVVVHRRVLSMPCEVLERGVLRLDNGEPVVLLGNESGSKVYPGALSGPFGYLEYASADSAASSQRAVIDAATKAGFSLTSTAQPPEIREIVQPTADSDTGSAACKDTERALAIVNTRPLPKHIGTQISGPRRISTPDPDYTPAMRRAKVQGSVRLQVLISAKGTVTVLKVIRPLSPEADEEAVNVVRKWKFEPARDSGKPIETVAEVEISFSLHR